LGFSSTAIGNILGCIRILTSFISPTVSAFADTHKVHRSVILSQLVLRTVPALLMWLYYSVDALTIWIFVVTNSLISVFSAGSGPLSDSLILASLDDKSLYGKIRLWGALAYGVGNLVLGITIHMLGGFTPMFAMSILTLPPALVVVYRLLPPFPSDIKPCHSLTFSEFVRLLTYSSSVRVFFVNSIIIGAALSLVESLLFVAMERAMNGSTPIIAGGSVFVSVLCEIPIFHFAPRLIERMGAKKMLIVANLAWLVRALGYAVFKSAWVVLILEFLHGITFGLYFSAAVYVCVKQSPPGMESTMQSLLDMTFSGTGVALGTILGGYLFDLIGTSETFIVFVILVGASTLAVLAFFQEIERSEVTPNLSVELTSPISTEPTTNLENS
jgi:PPP family 3-phenylpropionic acid transporter